MPLTLKEILVPLLAATAISGCSKPEVGDLLITKQEQIIAALNTTKPIIDIPDNTQNCMATLIGRAGENIRVIVACDDVIVKNMTAAQTSKGNFLTQVHGIAVLDGKLIPGQENMHNNRRKCQKCHQLSGISRGYQIRTNQSGKIEISLD